MAAVNIGSRGRQYIATANAAQIRIFCSPNDLIVLRIFCFLRNEKHSQHQAKNDEQAANTAVDPVSGSMHGAARSLTSPMAVPAGHTAYDRAVLTEGVR